MKRAVMAALLTLTIIAAGCSTKGGLPGSSDPPKSVSGEAPSGDTGGRQPAAANPPGSPTTGTGENPGANPSSGTNPDPGAQPPSPNGTTPAPQAGAGAPPALPVRLDEAGVPQCVAASETSVLPAGDLTGYAYLVGEGSLYKSGPDGTPIPINHGSGYGHPAQTVTGEWVRDGNRLIMVTAGWVAEQYLSGPEGLWAPDPANPAVLLRLLPPTLTDGVVWTQSSDGLLIWFRLQQPLPGTQGWRVTMLNRGLRYEYTFTPGVCGRELTVVGAEAAQSGLRLNLGGPYTALSPERRAAIIASSPALPATKPPVTGGSLASFVQMLAQMPGHDALTVDLNGDGRPERIVGTLSGNPWGTIEIQSLDGHTFNTDKGWGRLELVRLGSDPRPFFISVANERLSLHWYVYSAVNGFERMNAMGFGKGDSMSTEVTRYRVEADGAIRVEWEPSDRRDRRIRIYRLRSDLPMVELESETWEAR